MLNKYEFSQIDELYHQCFKDASVPTATLEMWLSEQTEGIICLRKDTAIVGALSYWFISSQDSRQFVSGTICERNLSVKSSDLEKSDSVYISEIALKPDCREKGLSLELIQMFLLEIERKYKWAQALRILALGYSDGGMALLLKMGFQKILDQTQSPDHQSLFELRIENINELINLRTSIGRNEKEPSFLFKYSIEKLFLGI